MSDLEARVKALEIQVDMIARMIGVSVARTEEVGSLLLNLTTKQHVALQMLLAGKSNAEIAERFGVTENGAKVYLRAIYKKFGVHTRSQAAIAVMEEWREVSEQRYLALSKGVPKGWSEEWLDRPVADDPYAVLYRFERED